MPRGEKGWEKLVIRNIFKCVTKTYKISYDWVKVWSLDQSFPVDFSIIQSSRVLFPKFIRRFQVEQFLSRYNQVCYITEFNQKSNSFRDSLSGGVWQSRTTSSPCSRTGTPFPWPWSSAPRSVVWRPRGAGPWPSPSWPWPWELSLPSPETSR